MRRHPPYDQMRNIQEALSGLVGGQKTAGRRLGMILEIMTFLFFQSEGLGPSMRKGNQLPSFAIDATHETDFSFHPILQTTSVEFSDSENQNRLGSHRRPVPSTTFPIVDQLNYLDSNSSIRTMKDKIIRNLTVNPLAVISVQDGERKDSGDPLGQKICSSIISLSSTTGSVCNASISRLANSAFAKVECKRVGIELTADSAPQTIEKAKQGAYAADHASSYQSILSRTGEKFGVVLGEEIEIGPYQDLRRQIINGELPSMLEGFCSTVFFFSEPSNWQTSDGIWKKDLEVLSSSFDWVIYLTDEAFIHFCQRFHIADTDDEDDCVREWIHNNAKLSEIPWNAYNQLMEYARENPPSEWFTVHTPDECDIAVLLEELHTLQRTFSLNILE